MLLNIAVYKHINMSSQVRDTTRLLTVKISAALFFIPYYLYLSKESYTSNLASKGKKMYLFLVIPDRKHVII